MQKRQTNPKFMHGKTLNMVKRVQFKIDGCNISFAPQNHRSIKESQNPHTKKWKILQKNHRISNNNKKYVNKNLRKYDGILRKIEDSEENSFIHFL